MFKYKYILVYLFILASISGVYFQVVHFDFVNFDDNDYVYQNKIVKQGITKEGILWAFKITDHPKTYWHPLTWLSHMIDCELFGQNAGMHHLTNVLIHVMNAMLLFMVLNRMTTDTWKSALVAFLFALHPVNVDTVAWVSERKNLLSTFFWMITMLCYVNYTRKKNVVMYLTALLTFLLGLLTKPMLVTLPFVF